MFPPPPFPGLEIIFDHFPVRKRCNYWILFYPKLVLVRELSVSIMKFIVRRRHDSKFGSKLYISVNKFGESAGWQFSENTTNTITIISVIWCWDPLFIYYIVCLSASGRLDARIRDSCGIDTPSAPGSSQPKARDSRENWKLAQAFAFQVGKAGANLFNDPQLYRKLILHASIRNFKVHTISEQIRINTGMNLMVKISFDRFLIIFYFFFVLKNWHESRITRMNSFYLI